MLHEFRVRPSSCFVEKIFAPTTSFVPGYHKTHNVIEIVLMITVAIRNVLERSEVKFRINRMIM